jgi:HSP20 family protein
MNTLVKGTQSLEKLFNDARNTFFGRTAEDILAHDFFNSLDANIWDEENWYRMEVAVPGMTRKDITIQVDGPVLRISAQKQKKINLWHAEEFSSTHFQRSFVLPVDADTSNITAKCRNGLLTIRVSKIKAKGTHSVIRIQGEEANTKLTNKVMSWLQSLKSKVQQLITVKK